MHVREHLVDLVNVTNVALALLSLQQPGFGNVE